jgi:hypothetical protein
MGEQTGFDRAIPLVHGTREDLLDGLAVVRVEAAAARHDRPCGERPLPERAGQEVEVIRVPRDKGALMREE